MGKLPRIIYCGRSNNKLDPMAFALGFESGLRLPFTAHYPPVFADQDWNNPDRVRYMQAVQAVKPEMATVLDWERQEQKSEVFSWADEISNYVQTIIIIPKFVGAVEQIPETLNGHPIVLGYSVPTLHGSVPTELKIKEFGDRPVHLLGGQPQTQMMLYRRMNVISVDCNYHARKANDYCERWTGMFTDTRMWRTVSKLGAVGDNSHVLAFALSCGSIMQAWHKIALGETLPFETRKKYIKDVNNL